MATFTRADKQRALTNARQEIARIEGQDTQIQMEIMAERARGYLEALMIMGAISQPEYVQLLREMAEVESLELSAHS
ncbi:hypothetical protein [Pseudomonas violetae]|uniref:Uncharacterized protein n=1 Tax=Pseudomonas violetae TaxID=2915813 RepID=A0ABT0F8F1_9PSED|nr:hypothetical protein [Pseudomonas violetae]MCK1794281.1 hypothetical protein [Pseudomonas violetae]